MSSKVKTNILYIASEDQSEPETLQAAPEKIKQTQPLPTTRFNIVGSHRLANNTISKGYFVPNNKHDNEYQYENPQKSTNSKILTNAVKLNPRSSRKFVPDLTDQKVIKKGEDPQQKQKKVQPEKQIKKSKNERIKTLMFELHSQQSDNEIQAKQLENKSDPGEQNQKPVFQIHNEKTQANNDEKQPENDEKQLEKKEIVALTPACIQKKIDKKQFLINQIPTGHILECKVTKKNELSNLMFSQFDMIFRNYITHVASCKKILGNMDSNYRISLDDQDFNYTRNKIIGKVRSSEGKQVYNIYDNGIKPELCSVDTSQVRQILATVRIKTRKGPRSLEVYLLKQGVKYSNLLGFKLKKEINLETLYSIEENRKSIILLKSREPEWVEAKKQYFLNFRGRIREASIRNFILEDPKTSQEVLLFGKACNNVYNIDISYPLTPMVGFGIVIPQLDRDD